MKIKGIEELGILLFSRPGAFALLLGSGISDSAGIPSGGKIAFELARRLMLANNPSSTANPRNWYAGKYKEQPSYSKIIKRIAKTKEEEISVLRDFIEPSSLDISEGRKVPSDAHKAIATLVRLGFVRLILTTNFDHLLEDAIKQEGISLRVLRDPKQFSAPYLLHECTIAMLNGDYTMGNILNSDEELSSFRNRGSIRDFLKRVFQEYGLVICGWSGESDPAISGLLASSFRSTYSLYWIAYRASRKKLRLGKPAARIVQEASGRVIEMAGSDEFFAALLDAVLDYKEATRPLKTSAEMVAAVKRYLPDPRKWIRLQSLFEDAIEDVNHKRFHLDMDPHFKKIGREEFQDTLRYYEKHSERLLRMMGELAYRGSSVPKNLISKSIRDLMCTGQRSSSRTFGPLQLYPALLLAYAAGMCAIANRNYYLLPEIFLQEIYIDPSTATRDDLNINSVFSDEGQRLLDDPLMRYCSAVSEHILRALTDPLHNYFSCENELMRTFDTFEYLMNLISYIRSPKLEQKFQPKGLFIRHFMIDDPIFPDRDFFWRRSDTTIEGPAWRELLSKGLFQPETAEFRSIHNRYRIRLFKYTEPLCQDPHITTRRRA